MSNSNGSKNDLFQLFQRIASGITFVTGFISSLVGFILLLQDPKKVGITTALLLIVGIGLLWGTCIYYARFWKPELQDKSPSAFQPKPSDRQVKAQQIKEQRRKIVRRSAFVGVFAIPILTVVGFFTWQYFLNLFTTNDIIILVADFEGPDPEKYRVTETILNNLHSATEEYSNVKVQALNKPITEKEGSEVARDEVEKYKATSIVIWGWYGKTEETVPISVHFEVLRPPEYLPKLEQEAIGPIQTPPIADLNSFKLQTRLSTEMTFLTLFTVGMVHYAAAEWDEAISLFRDSLEQVQESVPNLDKGMVYYFRGNSYAINSKYKEAVEDYTQALQFKPNSTEVYLNRGFVYWFQGERKQAINDFGEVIKRHPGSTVEALAYYNRGAAYGLQGNYKQAINDFEKVIKLNPDFAWGVYYNLGNVYALQGDYESAIEKYNEAIKLRPDFAEAYNNRGFVYAKQGNYEKAIADYTKAIQSSPIDPYTLNKQGIRITFTDQRQNQVKAYNNRGFAYAEQGNYEKAIADYKKAIELDPSYALAYWNRGVARTKLGDKQGAIEDFQTAAKLYQQYGMTSDYQDAVKRIEKLQE